MTVAQTRLVLDDELSSAEDLAATLARALQSILDNGCFDAEAQAIDALAEFAGYCRESCGFLDDGVCHHPHPNECGCICGHHEDLDPLSREQLRPQLTIHHPSPR